MMPRRQKIKTATSFGARERVQVDEMLARVDVVVETPYPLAGDACLSMDGPSGAVRDQTGGA
jgi:hypothetical protein